jgi:disulfide bond formation protein DsbB
VVRHIIRLSLWFLQPRLSALIMASVPLLLLTGALTLQYVGNILPCPLCLLERWAHFATLIFALIAWLRIEQRAISWPWLALATLTTAIGTAIAVFHVGVEQHWWHARCSSPSLNTDSIDELKQALLATPTVSCDIITWSFMTISLAGWNALISVKLAFYGFSSTVNSWHGSRKRKANGKPRLVKTPRTSQSSPA